MITFDSSSLKFWESVGLWGFVFVWVGVAGEGVEIFIKFFRPKLYNRKKSCLDAIGAVFWIVLVVALAVEFIGNIKAMRIADAENARLNERASKFELAAAELEQQMAQTSNNVVRIDPLKQSVSDVSAIALVEVKGVKYPDLAPGGLSGVASMMLCESNSQSSSFFPLFADNFGQVFSPSNGNRRAYSLRFHMEGIEAVFAGIGYERPVTIISDVNFLRINLNFLPKNSEILGGTAEIVVNGNIRKVFQILPQTDTNPQDGTANFPYIVIATNLVPANILQKQEK
jgi:hypothetical protein